MSNWPFSTLKDVLEHWKAGGTIGQLLGANSGNRCSGRGAGLTEDALLEFAPLLMAGKEDANWYCEAQLTLVAEDGNEPDREEGDLRRRNGSDPYRLSCHAVVVNFQVDPGTQQDFNYAICNCIFPRPLYYLLLRLPCCAKTEGAGGTVLSTRSH